MKTYDYDKEHDILSIHWGAKARDSAELFGGQLILDFDKESNVVGIEILDYIKELKKYDEELNKILKRPEVEE